MSGYEWGERKRWRDGGKYVVVDERHYRKRLSVLIYLRLCRKPRPRTGTTRGAKSIVVDVVPAERVSRPLTDVSGPVGVMKSNPVAFRSVPRSNSDNTPLPLPVDKQTVLFGQPPVRESVSRVSVTHFVKVYGFFYVLRYLLTDNCRRCEQYRSPYERFQCNSRTKKYRIGRVGLLNRLT